MQAVTSETVQLRLVPLQRPRPSRYAVSDSPSEVTSTGTGNVVICRSGEDFPYRPTCNTYIYVKEGSNEGRKEAAYRSRLQFKKFTM
jgi:hypothetical protein